MKATLLTLALAATATLSFTSCEYYNAAARGEANPEESFKRKAQAEQMHKNRMDNQDRIQDNRVRSSY